MDPTELVVWLQTLYMKMEIPYSIFKRKACLGFIILFIDGEYVLKTNTR